MTNRSDIRCATTSREAEVLRASREVPSWLTEPQSYVPRTDRDTFIAQSVLSVSSVLARLRMDDGVSSRFSPSAPIKLLLGVILILIVSLSKNFFFVCAMLAAVIVRTALLPDKALKRVAGVSYGSAAITLVIMAPAALFGQPHAMLTMATKTLVSTGIVMLIAMTTPFSQLTGALRAFHVPNLVIFTIDLTLRSIVRLGEVALEVLCALRLRSVGHNRDKAGSMGGVGGVVLLKAAEASQATYDAMRCRGFEGEYDVPQNPTFGIKDAIWLGFLVLVIILFLYLQNQV